MGILPCCMISLKVVWFFYKGKKHVCMQVQVAAQGIVLKGVNDIITVI